MSILLYVMMFVMLLSLSMSSFIKRGQEHFTLSSYYCSYFESMHKLRIKTAKAIYKRAETVPSKSPKPKKERAPGDKRHSNRDRLKNSSRFNLAFLFDEKPKNLSVTAKIFNALYPTLPLDESALLLFLKDLQNAGRTCKRLNKNQPITFNALRLHLNEKHEKLFYELQRGYIDPKDSLKDVLPLEHYMCIRENNPYALFLEQALPKFLFALFPKASVEALQKKEKEIKEKKEPKLARQAILDFLEKQAPIDPTLSELFDPSIPTDNDRIAKVKARQNGIMLQHRLEKET